MAPFENVAYDPEFAKQIYAESYASFNGLSGFALEKKFLRHRFQLLTKLFNLSIPTPSSYMDLGSGLGVKTRIMADFFTESVGVDFVERCIKVCKLLNDKPGLSFILADATQVTGHKYDFVSAFGLSVFNVHDSKACAEAIIKAGQDHCKPGGYLMVYSFTDFSGKAPTGWVNHTRKDLAHVLELLGQAGLRPQIVFPHRHFANYFGNGIRHLAGELIKLLSRKRRDYYIVIRTPKNGHG